jgi:hypothetical protein
MKAELPGSVATAPPNGTHRTAKKNGTRRPAPEASPVIDAPFLGVAAEPVDAPMWPIHQSGWFQPETPPSMPAWSGLSVERRNRVPAPELVGFEITPLEDQSLAHRAVKGCGDTAAASGGGTGSAAKSPEFFAEPLWSGSAVPRIPKSGLEPLGWDPRAICSKKESK